MEFEELNVQILLKCKSCKNCFIASTTKEDKSWYNIKELSKGKNKTTPFENEVKELSPNFVLIFGEAEIAEQEKLMQICGVGYRKALEFLIKDYLIKKIPRDEEIIKKKLLKDCIKDHIDSTKIKTIAEKAAWLGNDETHYVRKWEDKDLTDLKNLINITVHYILMELQADKYIEEMSSGK